MNENKKLPKNQLHKKDVSKISGGIIRCVKPNNNYNNSGGTPTKYKPFVVWRPYYSLNGTKKGMFVGQYDTFDKAWEKERSLLKKDIEKSLGMNAEQFEIAMKNLENK